SSTNRSAFQPIFVSQSEAILSVINSQQRTRSMTDTQPTGSYVASEINTDIGKEIQRLERQSLWGWPKESRNLALFGLSDGMRLLEVGSGPGFTTAHLLNQYPNLHITCIELDPILAHYADTCLQSQNMAGRYTIIVGDLMHMPQFTEAFDFAYARFVFQHLPDPTGALHEIHRTLKPGGKLAIHDIDIGLGEIIEPTNPEAEAIENKMHASQNQRGGNARIGRQLWRLLQSTGYTNIDLEIVPVHTDNIDFQTIFPPDWDEGAYAPQVARNIITQQDLETLYKAHKRFQASPDKYALFVSLMLCGQKVA
ncbi:MAG: methyltransferase domain-containing protein, partial [Chloroflexia bacterium]